MAFATCYQFAITIWFPTKVIALGMVIFLLISRTKRRQTYITSWFKPFIVIFFIVLLLGDLIAVVSPPRYALHFNKISRIINTNYTYITTALLLFYGTILKPGFVRRVFPSFCLAMEVAMAFGILHYICLSLGIEFMPILRQDGSINDEAAFADAGAKILRIYGVSGEPKSLAFLALPYIMASLTMFCMGHYRRNSTAYHLTALCAAIFVLINTYSSAALITFAIVFPMMLALLPFNKLMIKVVPLAIIATLGIGFYNAMTEMNSDCPQERQEESSLMDRLYRRSFERASEEMEGDRQERVVLDYMAEDAGAMTWLMGYGVAQYTFQIPGMTIGRSLIPMQSGFVLSLCDFGLLGIVLYGMLFLLIIKIIRYSKRYRCKYGMAFAFAALSSVIGSMMFGSIVTCMIYLMLALYGYNDELQACHLSKVTAR